MQNRVLRHRGSDNLLKISFFCYFIIFFLLFHFLPLTQVERQLQWQADKVGEPSCIESADTPSFTITLYLVDKWGSSRKDLEFLCDTNKTEMHYSSLPPFLKYNMQNPAQLDKTLSISARCASLSILHLDALTSLQYSLRKFLRHVSVDTPTHHINKKKESKQACNRSVSSRICHWRSLSN